MFRLKLKSFQRFVSGKETASYLTATRMFSKISLFKSSPELSLGTHSTLRQTTNLNKGSILRYEYFRGGGG